MKTAFGLLILAVPMLAGADLVAPVEDVATYVKIRKSPDAGADVVSRLHKSKPRRHVATVPGWHEVELEDGSTGFVSSDWSVIVAGQGDEEVTEEAVAEAPEPAAESVVEAEPAAGARTRCRGRARARARTRRRSRARAGAQTRRRSRARAGARTRRRGRTGARRSSSYPTACADRRWCAGSPGTTRTGRASRTARARGTSRPARTAGGTRRIGPDYLVGTRGAIGHHGRSDRTARR